MTELASSSFEDEPGNNSFPRKVLNALSRALGLDYITPLEEGGYSEGTWRGNLFYDNEGNIIAIRDADGIVH